MLNWIIAGTDAHAKNFSMLVGAGARSRLAPLYDMASTLPYDFDPGKLKMATRIGGKYLRDHILSRHWAKHASEVHLSSAEVLEMGRAMADTLPIALAETVDEARADGLDHPIMARMMDALRFRSEQCSRILFAAPE